MLIDWLIFVLVKLCEAFLYILPDPGWFAWPQGLQDAFEDVGYFFSVAGAFLPDGVLGHLAAALGLKLVVDFIVIPWLIARDFRLPFAALTKNSKT